MEEIVITPIEWSAPEYNHKKRSNDWLWSIGLTALVGAVLAVWFHNYVFAIFILISGACLILFTIREPQSITFVVKTEGITIGKDEHIWKDIKGFDIKKGEPYHKLLIMTSKKFLPIYTIPFPSDLSSQLKEALNKVTPKIDLEESRSMVFMEKLGF